MARRFSLVTTLSLVFLLAVGVGIVARGGASPETIDGATPLSGNPQTLLAAYERWKASLADEAPVLTIGLRETETSGHRIRSIRGFARVHLFDGNVEVSLSQAARTPDKPLDVWLLGSRSTGQDRELSFAKRLGTLADVETDQTRTLHATLKEIPKLDLRKIVVTASGDSPRQHAVLEGSLSLFQKLYVTEQNQVALSGSEALQPVLQAPFPTAPPLVATMSQLVTDGETIFDTEKFGGNGRTCASCHPSGNNFTIDPGFIATLPPHDALFVAESPTLPDGTPNPLYCPVDDPAACNTVGGKFFEIPHLMRSHSLILENVDGFPAPVGRDRFVMRSVQHLLGLSKTMGTGFFELDDTCIANRLGWSGDGSFIDPDLCVSGVRTEGTLREFAIGAVRQHFTKTLNRNGCTCEGGISCDMPGLQPLDFCLPTDDQLDALEAFQLSLGRSANPDIDGIVFTDQQAELGRDHFVNGGVQSPGPKSCKGCHANAGTLNSRNGRTGVEFRLRKEPAGLDAHRPPDGGLGTNPCLDKAFHNQAGTRNSTGAIEECATIPFRYCVGGPHANESCDDNSDCCDGGPCFSFCTDAPVAQDSTATAPLGGQRCVHFPAVNGCPVDENILCDGTFAGVPYFCLTSLDGSFGDLSFNIPSIIESADTAPFFHNSLADTLEEAIAFYAQQEFIQVHGTTLTFPIGGNSVQFFADASGNLPAVQAGIRDRLGAFLRALNSTDNIENTIAPTLDRASDHICDAEPKLANDLMIRARLDLDDVIEVLQGAATGSLNPATQQRMSDAKLKLRDAVRSSDCDTRRHELGTACLDAQVGRDLIATTDAGAPLELLECSLGCSEFCESPPGSGGITCPAVDTGQVFCMDGFTPHVCPEGETILRAICDCDGNTGESFYCGN